MGENIFCIKNNTDPTGLENFFVKTHFNLWTRYQLRVVNIDLEYETNAFPDSQSITIDNIQKKTDASYRMLTPIDLDINKTVNIFISRQFTCKYGRAADYGVITIKLEVGSSLWSGVKKVVVTGKLQPGGVLKSVRIQC